jgi:NADH-quinone oxidoreductase subunit I
MIQYIKNIWAGISSTLVGMHITWKHLFVKKVTIQYPDQRFPIPDNARNRLALDMIKCNGCTSCARACPLHCITIETVKATADDPHEELLHNGSKRRLWVTKYEIDFAKCCFCGMCTSVCATEAIVHTSEYEYSEYDRNKLVYKFHTLTENQILDKKQRLADSQAKEKESQNAAKQTAVQDEKQSEN